MDLIKKNNVVKATSYDYNAPHYVKIKNRKKMSQMLNRLSRRKLKQNLSKEDDQ